MLGALFFISFMLCDDFWTSCSQAFKYALEFNLLWVTLETCLLTSLDTLMKFDSKTNFLQLKKLSYLKKNCRHSYFTKKKVSCFLFFKVQIKGRFRDLYFKCKSNLMQLHGIKPKPLTQIFEVKIFKPFGNIFQ